MTLSRQVPRSGLRQLSLGMPRLSIQTTATTPDPGERSELRVARGSYPGYVGASIQLKPALREQGHNVTA
jgi:hypothetical protein